MIKVVVAGCCGKMGSEVAKLLQQGARTDMILLAGLSLKVEQSIPFPVYTNIDECIQRADVVIDFTTPQSALQHAAQCAMHHKAFVTGVTGFSNAQKGELEAFAKSIPILAAPNMSIGVHVLRALVEQAAKLLEGYDCEIVEMHHNQKLDAPSGTALFLGEAVAAARGQALEDVIALDRNTKRNKGDIGFASIRAGTIVGEHAVLFAGGEEIITIGHRALSRALFAHGALKAAAWIMQQSPGQLYSMEDCLYSGRYS